MTSGLLGALLLGTPASAVDIGWDRVEIDHLANGARAVAQDDDGFLWFATRRGLVRFDGERTVLVEPEGQHLSAWQVTVALGRVWTTTRAGLLYVVADGHLDAVFDQGDPVVAQRLAGSADSLWVGGVGQLRRLDRAGLWTTMTPQALPPDAHTFRLRPIRDGVLLASNEGLWSVSSAGHHERIRDDFTVDVAPLSDGRLVVQGLETLLIDGASAKVLLPHQNTRVVSLIARDDILYLTLDNRLIRITAEGQVSGIRRPVHGGPPLGEDSFVSDDGTLWMGNVRLPEPDTRVFGPDDGLSAGGRWVAIGPDGVVTYSSWGGTHRLTEHGPDGEQRLDGWRSSNACVDGRGRTVAFVGRTTAAGRERAVVDVATGEVLVEDEGGHGCAPSRSGGIWLLGEAEQRLLELRGDAVAVYTRPEAVLRALVETEAGQLVAVGHTTACEARSADVRSNAPDAWTCTELPVAVGPNVVCAVEVEPGLVWACTEGDGVWERTGPNSWAPSPVNGVLAVRGLDRARVARSGGVWLHHGDEMVRVERRRGEWALVERVGAQVGLATAVSDLDEDAAGNLWLAGVAGAAFVPAHRRIRSVAEHPPRLISASVDGVPSREPLLVPAGGGAELHFAALAYRFSTTLRYRWRLGEGEWSTPSRSGAVRLAGLASGATGLEVSTTVDGRTWSKPLRVDLSVRPPWYARPWVWLAAVVALGAGALGVERLRARIALDAERQRSRIAMDLHDELGAGLGSISILAGLLTSDRVNRDRARDAASRIAASAEELGGSVTDIVWSLRTQSHDLGTLITYVQDRAQGMVDLDRVRLRRVLPDPMPRVRLHATLARAAQLILIEAAYNAARHSGATEIVLEVRREGRTYSIAVADNGCGITDGPLSRPGGGTGMTGMRTRAEQVGARLQITSAPGEGTVVKLTLPGSSPGSAGG